MKINFGTSIIDYLQDHKVLSVPGLGSFELVGAQDDFELENHKISPPSKTVSFSGQTDESGDFASYLSARWNITEKQAVGTIHQNADNILKSILDQGKAFIPGLGQFIQDSDGKLIFQPLEYNFDLKYYMLPELALNPVEAAPVFSPVQSVTEVEATSFVPSPENSLTEKLWRSILFLLAFIAVLILLMRACDNEISSPISSSATIKTLDTSGKNNLIDGKNPQGSTNLSEESIDSGSLIDPLEENNPIISKYREVLTDEVLEIGCIIVVGSFTKASNVIRMKDRIIRAGLQPYTEEYGKFTRVGILFECGEHDLITYMDTIRKNFELKSWYLYPQYNVPFD